MSNNQYKMSRYLQKNNNNFSALQPDFNCKTLNKQLFGYLQETYVLTVRLIKQSLRRPSLLITSIIQPLLWLIIFSALFQHAPIQNFTQGQTYSEFISSGIIVFTGFTASLNSGLPIMFDREFGFFNRIISSSIYSRYSILISSSIHIIISSFIQIGVITWIINNLGQSIQLQLSTHILKILLILFLLSNTITSLSLILAFILPGHIELLACILIINLPLLFCSTALAPMHFMPSWLQIIASINPLTYAIETIRYIFLNQYISSTSIIANTIWGPINFEHILIILIGTNLITVFLGHKLIANKFED
uniref:ABC transmembrane type-2 domain-containing protein n=1 Tax=Hommersandiophycus borowitzkae TaxID=268573 RepID=A0A1G4NU75_9FLOR|nr:Hypothetical protein ycf38 [Hommersandiophycus borowitzkae]SCW22232.1 Hypothetical protein ycf38 [Hommersandiophycus borowitzkae]